MPSVLITAVTGTLSIAVFMLIGYPVARLLGLRKPILWSTAVGMGVFSAGLPTYLFIFGSGYWELIAYLSVLLVAAGLWLTCTHSDETLSWDKSLVFGLIFSLIVSASVVSHLFPKEVGSLYRISYPLLDHAKVALIDAFVREGFPLQNPFSEGGSLNGATSYYYGWYLLAGVIAAIAPVTGWEADIALTFSTAFASLCVVMGLTSLLSGDSKGDGGYLWAILICLSGFVYSFSFHGLETWLIQAVWVPQHVMAASLATIGLIALTIANAGVLSIVFTSMLISAGFGMSTWVGGIAFAVCASGVLISQLFYSRTKLARLKLGLMWLAVASVCALLSWHYILVQLPGAALKATWPVAVLPWSVIKSASPWSFWNLLAFWLFFLPLQMPAIVFSVLLYGRAAWQTNRIGITMIVITFSSMLVSWVMQSTIANNDLGWRGILPALFTGAAIGGWGIARVVSRRRYATILLLIGAGLMSSSKFVVDGLLGNSDASIWRYSLRDWAVVQQSTEANARILSDPRASSQFEPWQVNIGWALMSDRKSCFASIDYLRAFGGSWSVTDVEAFVRLIYRVFDGVGTSDDFRILSQTLKCDYIVVKQGSGLFTGDRAVYDPYYRLQSESNSLIILNARNNRY